MRFYIYVPWQAIQRVQAPEHDDETKTMWAVIKASLASAANATAEDTDAKPRAICNALEFLLNSVGAMRIDAAKRPPAPHLCGH